jgi:hypothetical protein
MAVRARRIAHSPRPADIPSVLGGLTKELLIGCAIFAALCAIALLVVSLNPGSVVTRAVNGYAPGLLKTRVSLSSARISPFSGNGTLHGFVIGNPSGWSDGDLVSIKGVHVSIVPSSIVRDHIIINEIDIDASEFDYETRLVASNVKDLLGNIEQAVGARSAPRAAAKNGKPVNGTRVDSLAHAGRLGGAASGAVDWISPKVYLSQSP